MEITCRKTMINQLFIIKIVMSTAIFAGIILTLWSSTIFAANCEQITKIAPKLSPQILQSDIKIIKGVVQNGDTATSLLKNHLTLKSIYEIDLQSTDIFSLTRIRKGQPYKIILQDGNLIGFEYAINKEDKLVIHCKNETFSINIEPIKYDIKIHIVSSTISYSLCEAVRKSGERNELAFRLSDIFAWDIDFIRDIQSGDEFSVLVEKQYQDGKLAGYGNILAAFFTNKGTFFKAFLHKDTDGISRYYDENGKSLQKAFLKAPPAFSRISSKFTKKRFHPILKENRPHHGIDYAASKGTPIKTVGDGTILRAGYNKGKGNFITIRHNNGYITSYYHMCKFAKGMKKNKRVLQGDLIGYVGMTGYATGPHLCFRMKKDGKPVNPLKYKSPSAKPVKADEMKEFTAKTVQLSARMAQEQKLASLE
jgi:murein DD-endopeptidase MepM/ murein hydrolase activator NlpD